MKLAATLFDLDGTLLDTLDDLCDSMNRVLAAQGFSGHPRDAYRYFVGDGAAKLAARALPEDRRSESAIRACLAAFNRDYDKNWNIKTKPYEGVPAMLTGLAERGLKLAVLSNKPDTFTRRCVTELLPDWRFDAVVGQRDDIAQKPDPAGAMEICTRLDVPPSGVMYVGDSGVDMRTAVAAGMYPVGALWGFRRADELRENGAKVLLQRPEDVLRLLA